MNRFNTISLLFCYMVNCVFLTTLREILFWFNSKNRDADQHALGTTQSDQHILVCYSLPWL